MSNYMEEAMRPATERYRQQVLQRTWGHLAPKRGVLYRGRIVYVCGVFNSGYLNPTIIFCDLRSRKYGELSSSPWFYEAVHDFVAGISWKPEREHPPRKGHGEEGCVYEWTGYFKNYEFVGTVRMVFDANKPHANQLN